MRRQISKTERDEFDNKFIYAVTDDRLGLLGYLAVDSTVNGYSCGGVRMAPDIPPSEIAQLAQLMTLKYGFIGLPIGGAKVAIIGDPEMASERKEDLLKRFGRALKPFVEKWRYIPQADLGTTGEDIEHMLSGAGLGIPLRGRMGRTALFTGLSVAVAAAEAARYMGRELVGLSVAIEGFGKVGSSAAREFQAMGVKLTAISNTKGAIYNQAGFDVATLIKLYNDVGSEVVNAFPEGERIDKAELLEADVDILSPCAEPFSIREDNAAKVSAKIISPGANLPMTREAEQILHERGILCIPDFVANCGGVLGASMEATGLREDFIRQFIQTRLAQRVRQLIEAAGKERIPVGEHARELAMQRFLRVKDRAERNSRWIRMLVFALYLYRKGFIPSQLMRPLSQRYFEKRVL